MTTDVSILDLPVESFLAALEEKVVYMPDGIDILNVDVLHEEDIWVDKILDCHKWLLENLYNIPKTVIKEGWNSEFREGDCITTVTIKSAYEISIDFQMKITALSMLINKILPDETTTIGMVRYYNILMTIVLNNKNENLNSEDFAEIWNND